MKVLIIGNGGREHALAWKIAQSSRVDRVFVAPGNAGTATDAINVPISATDIPGLLKFAKTEKIDFTVVGPEAPLALGGRRCFSGRGISNFWTIESCGSAGKQQGLLQESSKASGRPDGRLPGLPRCG